MSSHAILLLTIITLLVPCAKSQVTFSSDTLSFGNQKVLTRGPVQTLTFIISGADIVSTGTASLSGTNPEDFTVSSNCSGTELTPSSSCTIFVAFSPLFAGSRSANLNLSFVHTGNRFIATPGGSVSSNTDGQLTATLTGTGNLGGMFEIFNAGTGDVLQPLGGSLSNGAAIQQNALNGLQMQQWQFVAVANGAYEIVNAATGKVLDVTGASSANRAQIQQWTYLGGLNQLWRLVPVDDVHYAILNVNSGKALDVPNDTTTAGTTIQQWDYLGDPQQLWVLVPADSYTIENAFSLLTLDVASGSMNLGVQITQATPNGVRDQQWQFVPTGGGYWALLNRNSGLVLDDTQGSLANGNNMQQYEYFPAVPSQQWQVLPVDATNSIFVNRASGKVLDDTGYSTTSGTLIQQWGYLAGSNQQWQIQPVILYNIVNKLSGLTLDVPDASPANGQQIQQWKVNGVQQQNWQLVGMSNNRYIVVNDATSKVLDDATQSMADGAPVEQTQYTGATSQQWNFNELASGFYEIQNALSGKVLDVVQASMQNGALIQQYDYFGTGNQQWQLVPVTSTQVSSAPQAEVTLDTPGTGATQVTGHVYNVDPNTAKIVIYGHPSPSNWSLQLSGNQSLLSISADGSWAGSEPPTSTFLVLLVDPLTYAPQATEMTIPALDPGVLAYAEYPSGGPEEWSGYTWETIQTGEETYLTQSLGYGTYQFAVVPGLSSSLLFRVSSLAIETGPGQGFEFDYDNTGIVIAPPANARFAVQPFTAAGNLFVFTAPDTYSSYQDPPVTVQMEWAPDHITFALNYVPGVEYLWTYAGSNVPKPGQDHVHIKPTPYPDNLAILGGVSAFSFQPLANTP